MAIRAAIETYKYDERPVTTILAATFKTAFADEALEKKERDRRRGRLHAALRSAFETRINQQVTVGNGHLVTMRFEPASTRPTYFWSRSGYSDQLKAAAMKEMVKQLNDGWAAQIRANRGAIITVAGVDCPGPWQTVSVNFLLSSPLDYLDVNVARTATGSQQAHEEDDSEHSEEEEGSADDSRSGQVRVELDGGQAFYVTEQAAAWLRSAIRSHGDEDQHME